MCWPRKEEIQDPNQLISVRPIAAGLLAAVTKTCHSRYIRLNGQAIPERVVRIFQREQKGPKKKENKGHVRLELDQPRGKKKMVKQENGRATES